MKKIFVLFFMVLTAFSARSQNNTLIKPGELWPDSEGKHINVHGGGILRGILRGEESRIAPFIEFKREETLLIPIPGKNIVMVRELAETPFPPGDLHLQGPDW